TLFRWGSAARSVSGSGRAVPGEECNRSRLHDARNREQCCTVPCPNCPEAPGRIAGSQKNSMRMKRNANKGRKVRPKLQWTAEDRARHQAIREMFQDWHPSPEELIASGEGANFDLQGEYRALRPFVAKIKRAREAAGLTLAEVS